MKMRFPFFKDLLTMLILSTFVLSCNDNSKTNNDNYEHKTFQSSFLSVDPIALQLGEIDKNDMESIPFVFHIKNEHDTILVIDKIDVSCSCVKINQYPKQLGVDQTDSICGKIDLKNQSGHMRKSIYINYCDTCATILKIVADVID